MDNQSIVAESLEPFKDLTVRDYAALKGKPEATIRSQIRLGKINTVDIEVDGKIQRGIRVPLSKLSPDDEQLSLDDVQSSSTISPSSAAQSIDYHLIIGDRDERITELKSIIINHEATIKDQSSLIVDLQEQLKIEQIRAARLDEAAKSKDSIIDAIRGEANAIKGAFALLEQQKNPAIPSESSAAAHTKQRPQEATKKGWLDRMLGR